MQRPFAWIAVVAAVVAALSALLPWHTIEVNNPLLALGGEGSTPSLTHRGIDCGLHGVWLLVLAGLAAVLTGGIALGLGQRLPFSPCRVMIVAAALLAAAALLVVWDLFRDSLHCFEVAVEDVKTDERENGFYIAAIASMLGAMSAGVACLVRREAPDANV